VFGAGTVGILVAAAAKIQGASQVVITDIDSGRVQYAEKNGFAHKGWTTTLRKPSGISEQLEVAREVSLGLERDGLPGKYDAVFECTGAESCLQAAIYVSSHLAISFDKFGFS
jgi:L-iditol 2-dehydrogenase